MVRLKRLAIFMLMLAIIVTTCAALSKFKEKVYPDGSHMVRIPAGEFMMGDDRGDADERPAHKVLLKVYWMDKTEVTCKLYDRCVAEGSCKAPEKYAGAQEESRPAVGVSWEDAAAYCAWAGKRLPTEAEWEKAARGAEGREYPWGAGIDCTLANYRECGVERTLPVGSYPKGASAYGMLDMAGNAWEWVADYYDPEYYKTAPPQDPKGPESGKYRVARGGSWNRPLYGMRSADRGGFKPETRSDDIGFRCASDKI